MKKALCVAAVLALVAGAYAADGRLFITKVSDGYGLTNPGNALIPTASSVDAANNNLNALDYTNGGWVIDSYPPAAAPSTYPTDLAPGDVVYLWGRFTSSTVPALNTKINGLELGLKANNVLVTPIDSAFYLANDVEGEGFKRWDGTATPPNYPEFTDNNTQTLVGVDAYGIKNRNSADAFNLYGGSAGFRTFLLGAFVVPDVIGQYEYDAVQVNYSSGEGNQPWDSAFFNVIPEPASLVLLGLAGLLIRRR